MEYRKIMVLLALVVFLLSIAGVSASEIDNTIASENANTIELSADNDIEDNLQTSEENEALASTDYDEDLSAQTDTEVLGADSAKYSDLAEEISQPGNINLTHKYYTYDKRGPIIISEANKVIDGNGAVIDMNGSTIMAFHIKASGVTIKNLTIINANYNGDGGAIYFSSSVTSGTVSNCNFTNNTATSNGGAVCFGGGQGTVSNCNFAGNTAVYGGAIIMRSGTVSNCNFVDNKAAGDYSYGGAVYFSSTGTVTNCNFTNNSARYGGAVEFDGTGNVTNCNFTNNTASEDGGAINMGPGTVSNCNFTNNKASGDGGAINMGPGTVSNCNFVNNTASGDGGAINIGYGTVTNCNFTNNTATGTDNYDGGGAVYFYKGTGSVTNCNFADNTAYRGGAVYFYKGTGSVTNCNFTCNTATYYGGAVYFLDQGTVSNCNFTDNTATSQGGAIRFSSTGTVSNCNFTNSASNCGGAVYFYRNGDVTNCNFTDNTASEVGGAIFFVNTGTVTNCNFINNTATNGDGGAINMGSGTVTNCNFTGNNAAMASAIYFWSTSDNKTVSNSRFLNNRANAEALEVTKNDNNITITLTGNDNLLNAIYSRNDAEVTFINVTYWGANVIANTGSSPTNPARSNKEAGQNITVGVVVNGEIVLSGVYHTDENGMIVLDISAGDNYFIGARHNTDSYYTEAEKTISNNTKFNVNVTSQTTNNRTVNITAKSNIPNEVIDGKLLFILPNNINITANYAGNGTWWAEHIFEDYAVYQVNATYVGLDNVTVNNGTISISKIPTNITVENTTVDLFICDSVGAGAVLTPADAGNLTFTSSNSSVAKVEDGKIMAVGEGTANITVSFAGSDDYAAAENKTISVTVTLKNASVSVNNSTLDLFVDDIFTIVATTNPDGLTVTFVQDDSGVYIVDENGVVTALREGKGSVLVKVGGDGVYAENFTVVAVNVIKYNSKVTISPINDTAYSNNVIIKYSVENRTNVIVTIDGVSTDKIIITNDTITVVGLDAGKYTITILNNESEMYYKSGDTKSFTVNKLATSISAADVSATYNINRDLVVTLKDSTGKALSGVKVTVDLKGAKTYTTDKNGKVKVSTKGLAPKKYTAKITFNGNTNYVKSTKSVKVTVKKAKPKMTAKKKTYKTTTKTKKYTIVLKNNVGKAIKNAKVTLKVKGKTYKAKTNSKGKATFKIKNLKKKGTFKAVIKYKGNKYYKKLTKNVKIKVIVKFKTVSRGSKDKATVKEIQRALKDKGYYLTYQGHYLKIDGKYSSCTVRSIKEFQHDKGLKVTGKVDEKTAVKLGILK